MAYIPPVLGIVTEVFKDNAVRVQLRKYDDSVVADPIEKPRQPPIQIGEEVFVYYTIREQRTHYAHPNFLHMVCSCHK